MVVRERQTKLPQGFIDSVTLKYDMLYSDSMAQNEEVKEFEAKSGLTGTSDTEETESFGNIPEPGTFPFSMKFEPTQYGWRIHNHVYGTTIQELKQRLEQSFEMAEQYCKDTHKKIAPMGDKPPPKTTNLKEALEASLKQKQESK
jgi:hypothetical protein